MTTRREFVGAMLAAPVLAAPFAAIPSNAVPTGTSEFGPNDFEAFQRATLAAIAAGMRVPYEKVLLDFSETARYA